MPGYDPMSEADGRYIIAFAESAGEVSPVFERKVRETFQSYLPSLDADQWYDTDNVVTAFDKINEEIGEKTIEQGAREATRTIPWPDDTDTLEDAVPVLREAHRDAYRNSDQKNPAGNYKFDITGDRRARVAITEGFPYGEAWGQGVFKELATLFSDNAAPDLEPTTAERDEIAAWTLTW